LALSLILGVALLSAASVLPCLAVELFGPRLGLRTGAGPSHVVRADFDGNGVPDFAVANWTFGTVSVMLGDGLGGFDEAPEIEAADSPTSIAAGDFNADGNADLVVADVREDALILLFGDGEGRFTLGDAIATGGDPQFVIAGDFDFDGDEDLAVANSGDDTVSGAGANDLRRRGASPHGGRRGRLRSGRQGRPGRGARGARLAVVLVRRRHRELR
jgi:hypothetical protein